MQRFRAALLTAFLAGLIPGCGENQPNSPQPNESRPTLGQDCRVDEEHELGDGPQGGRQDRPGPGLILGPRDEIASAARHARGGLVSHAPIQRLRTVSKVRAVRLIGLSPLRGRSEIVSDGPLIAPC